MRLPRGARDEHQLRPLHVLRGVNVDPERSSDVDRLEPASLGDPAALHRVPRSLARRERVLRGLGDGAVAEKDPGIDGVPDREPATEVDHRARDDANLRRLLAVAVHRVGVDSDGERRVGGDDAGECVDIDEVVAHHQQEAVARRLPAHGRGAAVACREAVVLDEFDVEAPRSDESRHFFLRVPEHDEDPRDSRTARSCDSSLE